MFVSGVPAAKVSEFTWIPQEFQKAANFSGCTNLKRFCAPARNAMGVIRCFDGKDTMS
jgi:hypothetical protein